MLAVFGAVVPLDPVTGLPIGKLWVADSNTAAPSRTYTVARFPVQAGYGLVTDAAMRNPPAISVEFLLTDIAPLGHKIDSYRNRRYKLAADFELIEARLGPVLLFCRGFPPLRDYVIASVTPAPQDGKRVILLSVSFEKVNYTTLFSVPPGVSPDLLAGGILPV